MTASMPDHTAILAAASLEPIPPLPTAATRSAGDGLEFVVDLDHLLDERGIGLATGIAGQQPGGVGQQDQQPGPDQVGHQGGQAVVVAEADLLVGHRVVLVDHRDHAEFEQAPERLAGVQVLAAVDEVEGGQEDLAGGQPVGAEGVAPHPHEQVLADGGHRLEGGQIVGTGPPLGQARPAGGDGARGHHDHPVARPGGPGPPRRPACRWRRCPPGRRRWSPRTSRSSPPGCGTRSTAAVTGVGAGSTVRR